MLGFWIAAAIVSAATGAVMLAFARRAQREGAGSKESPTVAAYERQLQEVDELAGRGLLGAEEREAARSEAARRLLQAARSGRSAPDETRRTPGWAAPAAAVAAPLLAMAIYLGVGRPEAPDQPFRERVAQWRDQPERLGPAEAAAVLETVARERPLDAEVRRLLGRARLAAGDSFGAVRALEEAARLEPGSARRWTDLAQGLLSLETPDAAGARRALARALAAAPGDVNARYWLGRADLAEGRAREAAERWRTLAADLPAGDPARAALQTEIAAVDQPSETGPAIAGMVDRLARRLEQDPADAAGWARLARAYAVLGRERELAATLREVRRRFADRPEVIARADAEVEVGRRVQRAR